jgi:hypothetical protein
MKKEKIDELIVKYNEGQADPSELKQIEQLIEEGSIQLTQLHELYRLEEQLDVMVSPSPSGKLDYRFYEMLDRQKAGLHRFSWRGFLGRIVDSNEAAPRMAWASLALVAGIFIGYMFKPARDDQQVAMLSNQVNELKEMMMLSLLEKESATERLRAVSLTQEMDQVSSTVTNALFQTLDNDQNINVRLAALEALKPYVRNDSVRQRLVQSIAKQESPLVQVALADLMVALQERRALKELEKIRDDERTPYDVRKRIDESIKVMI